MPKRRITQAQADALEHGLVVALTEEQFEHLNTFAPETALPAGVPDPTTYYLDGQPIHYVLTWMHRINLREEIHINTDAILPQSEAAVFGPPPPVTGAVRTIPDGKELFENGVIEHLRQAQSRVVLKRVKDVEIEIRGSIEHGFTYIERDVT